MPTYTIILHDRHPAAVTSNRHVSRVYNNQAQPDRYASRAEAERRANALNRLWQDKYAYATVSYTP